MIKNALGKSNTTEIFQHMVGERIAAMFEAKGRLWIVTESGDAVWMCSLSGRAGETSRAPAFGTERKEDVDRVVAERRAEIEAKLAQLRDLPGTVMP